MNVKEITQRFDFLAPYVQLFLRYFDRRHFLYGLGGVGAFYLILFLYALIFSGSTISHLEEDLASLSVPVMHRSAIQAFVRQEDGIPGIALPPAPDVGLYEHNKEGSVLPIIRKEDGATPFSFYKRPNTFPTNTDLPIAAIAVEGFGLSFELSQKLVSSLPVEISFILSPYSDNTQGWLDAARESGHEVWLEMPIENYRAEIIDPGPAALMVRSNLDKNRESLDWIMSRASGYTGLAAFTDNKFFKAELMLETLSNSFLKRGLGYMEINPNGDDVIENAALEQDAPFIRTSLIGLKGFEDILVRDGLGLLVIPSTPEAIEELKVWMEKNKDNILFVPASAYYDAPLHLSSSFEQHDTAPKSLHRTDHYEPEAHH